LRSLRQEDERLVVALGPFPHDASRHDVGDHGVAAPVLALADLLGGYPVALLVR